MEMTAHLNEEELAELVLSSPPAVSAHLAQCDKCLNEVSRLRDWIREQRDAREPGDEFWAVQERAIRNKLASTSTARKRQPARLAWAAAVATAAIAVALLNAGKPRSPQATAQVKVDPDHELLLEVERSLQTGGPEALEPAALLAREIGQQSVVNPASRPQKETSHEN